MQVPSYEHRTVTDVHDAIDSHIAKLRAEGWEPVMMSSTDNGGRTKVTVMFRRAIQRAT